MYTITRVYNNGEQREFLYGSSEEVMQDLPYNMDKRWGCAYFVNGICVQNGYLDQQRIDALVSLWKTPDK